MRYLAGVTAVSNEITVRPYFVASADVRLSIAEACAVFRQAPFT